jgi:23S rRNA (guanosine2251-2'-O)-methyltransferase
MKMETEGPVLVLDNVRSVHNVGSIFRTADACGVRKIYLVGVTPTPIDRFGRERSDLHKTALGAEKSVAWEHADNILNLMQNLKNKGYFLLAVEQSSKSIDYKEAKPPASTAYIFGNEVDGLSASLLEESDLVAEIPMLGRKESLNVSVAVGVALFGMIPLKKAK